MPVQAGEQVVGVVHLRERVSAADRGVHAVSHRVGRRVPSDRPCRPAVVIYNSVTAVQAVGWILVSGAALRNRLARDEKSAAVMRDNRRNGYFALVVYSSLALIAFWFPLTIAVVTTMLWAYWLAFSLRTG